MSTPSRLERRAALSPATLTRLFRTMYCSRRIDDKEIQLKRQNKIHFQISGAGHEAIQVAAAAALRPGYDWFYAYYRDRALALQLGITPYEQFLAAVGSSEDPFSGGRQMPSHWSSRPLRIVSSSSPTGTQFLQATGCAEAARYLEKDTGALTLVSSGEGATSEGEFWEAMNAACLNRLPLLFLISFVGALSSVTELKGFPDVNYTAFQYVYALLQAVAFAGAVAGTAMIEDFESGFMNRLMVASRGRAAIVVGYVIAMFVRAVIATLVLTGQNDTTASPTAHGRPHYDSIPTTTIKQYVEAAAGNHQSAFSPNGLTARYAISWLKYNVDGDARYRPFLDRAASGISNFDTTVK